MQVYSPVVYGLYHPGVMEDRLAYTNLSYVQVYSPVVYGLYHPGVVDDRLAYTNQEVRSTLGRYRIYDYSVVSFYMVDYKKGALKLCTLKNVQFMLHISARQ